MTTAALAVVVIFSFLVCHYFCNNGYSREGLTSKVIRVEGGWGYDIFLEKKMIIHQPFIPALSGAKPFASRRAAKRVARVVIDQLVETGSPTLTIETVNKILEEN